MKLLKGLVLINFLADLGAPQEEGLLGKWRGVNMDFLQLVELDRERKLQSGSVREYIL